MIAVATIPFAPTRSQRHAVQAHVARARGLAGVQARQAWEEWGYHDFDAYCRKELHLRSSAVAKLLGSYRFLETSAPRVIERARQTDHFE